MPKKGPVGTSRKIVPISNCRPCWQSRLDKTHEILVAIRQARTADQVCASILGFTARFGATALLAGTIPPPGAMRREQVSHVLLDAWPREWSIRYFSHGYLHWDPTIGLVRRASEPFIWSNIAEHIDLPASALRVMQEATEFGLNDGLTLTFSSVERRPIGFSIAGERLELDPPERRALELVVACGVAQAVQIDHRSARHGVVRLSPRQHDVLRWAAEGLKVEEIADRLSISAHTADMHLRNVRERLGVSNTIHAVAEAFRRGMIS